MMIVNTLAVEIELTIFPPMSFEQHDDFKWTMLDYVSVEFDNLQKKKLLRYFL